jgi:hypothetical protein
MYSKENTAYAEPPAKAEADVALMLKESYTFFQCKENEPPGLILSNRWYDLWLQAVRVAAWFVPVAAACSCAAVHFARETA